ncbi:unnamed protein product [Dovyalis caffra]|uniref:Uncharacterized protein n=1 Tax=Dovyalis caffra TaxID=77055 RepID=A0AAV1RHR5_9ROSI|nr:unnamed protein product [Dovyalis caffra]
METSAYNGKDPFLIKLYDQRMTKRGAVQSYEGHVNSHTRLQLGVDQSERFVMAAMKSANPGRTLVVGHGLDRRKDYSTCVSHESDHSRITYTSEEKKSHRGFKSPTGRTIAVNVQAGDQKLKLQKLFDSSPGCQRFNGPDKCLKGWRFVSRPTGHFPQRLSIL